MVTRVERQFLLPDLGEGLTEAAIVTWLVAPGDLIAIDQSVVEVESAKSIVELPSPYGGRVVSLDAAQGVTVTKGQSLLTIAAIDEAGVAVTPEPPSGSGAVLVGYGTTESTMRIRRPEGGRFGAHRQTVDARESGHDIAAAATALLDPARRSPVVSPLVRRKAKLNGFDAAQLVGSGPGSLVLRDDVEAAIATRVPRGAPAAAPAIAPTTTTASAGTSPSQPVEASDDIRTAMTPMQKLISARLGESRRVIPEVTIWLDVDATELLRAQDRLQHATGERFSTTTLIARFAVAGLRQFPALNASVDAASNEIVQHGTINLGIAAQTRRGLMVPVIHEADSLTTRELRDAVSALVEAARTGDFAPAALHGGTFTLNNYGGFGVDGSTPIINYPEVAMLGVGRMLERPWVVAGALAVRTVVTLSFVFDHRVCDGSTAAGFLTFIARRIEEPLLLLGEL